MVIVNEATVLAHVNDAVIRKRDLAILAPDSPEHALGLLVDFTLLDQAASKSHLKVTDAEMASERQRLEANERVKSFKEAAAKSKHSEKGMDVLLRHARILQKLAEHEVGKNLTGMFHARGILIRIGGEHGQTLAAIMPDAKRLQRKVQAGADIAELAKRYSEDRLSKPTGGDLGVISSFGAPNMVKQSLDFDMQLALSRQLGKAKAGEVVSGPVVGKLGCWVLKIVSTQEKPDHDGKDYDRALQLYRSQWISKYEPLVMMHLRASAKIDPPLDGSTLSPTVN